MSLKRSPTVYGVTSSTRKTRTTFQPGGGNVSRAGRRETRPDDLYRSPKEAPGMEHQQGTRDTNADATSATKRTRKFEKNGRLATAEKDCLKETRDTERLTGTSILGASVSRAERHTGRLLKRKRRNEISSPVLEHWYTTETNAERIGGYCE